MIIEEGLFAASPAAITSASSFRTAFHVFFSVDRTLPVLLHLYFCGICPTSLEGINLRDTFDFPIADCAERLMPSLNPSMLFLSKRTGSRRCPGCAFLPLLDSVKENSRSADCQRVLSS
ncbi:hypothetical protein BN2476_990007 [Paraburkholderia piptadeniae]|uniref:Uncharacterized protein n=1 Tax=Paraburkholderia piptadeniae TaxID=1701573 RepID=A0A1N7SU65_9BURK|nr:hypothetical protein [Paraburkholderia piptadeniae]SIT51029.1 hypothetical protein BN2476_990007 [Paraburkholderia piptadeniae]